MNSETMNVIITAVLVPILIALAGFIVDLIHRKSAEIQARTKNATAQKYIVWAENLVCQSVQKIFQVYVDAQKDAQTFGKEEAQIAFNKARLEILKLLTIEAREAIVMIFGDIDAWISVMIEYQVRLSNPYKLTPLLITPDDTLNSG